MDPKAVSPTQQDAMHYARKVSSYEIKGNLLKGKRATLGINCPILYNVE